LLLVAEASWLVEAVLLARLWLWEEGQYLGQVQELVQQQALVAPTLVCRHCLGTAGDRTDPHWESVAVDQEVARNLPAEATREALGEVAAVVVAELWLCLVALLVVCP
jgi:hypothetical protein